MKNDNLCVDDAVECCNITTLNGEYVTTQCEVQIEENGKIVAVDDHFVLGNCKTNCEALCFPYSSRVDDQCLDFTGNDKSIFDCSCVADPKPILVPYGEKCCSPLGIVVPDNICCPGNSMCCGLSATECISQVIPSHYGRISRKLPQPPPNVNSTAPPIFIVRDGDTALLTAKPGTQLNAEITYPDSNYSQDEAFNFTVLKIIQNVTQDADKAIANITVGDEVVKYLTNLTRNFDTVNAFLLSQSNVSSDFIELVNYLDAVNFTDSNITSLLPEVGVTDEDATYLNELNTKYLVFIGQTINMADNTSETFLGMILLFGVTSQSNDGYLFFLGETFGFFGEENLVLETRRLGVADNYEQYINRAPTCSERYIAAEADAETWECEGNFKASIDSDCALQEYRQCEEALTMKKNEFEEYTKKLEFIDQSLALADASKTAKDVAKCIYRCAFPWLIPPVLQRCSAKCIIKHVLMPLTLELAGWYGTIATLETFREEIAEILELDLEKCFNCDICPQDKCCPDCALFQSCCLQEKSPFNDGGVCKGSDLCCPGEMFFR